MVIQQFFSSTLLGVECYAVQSGLRDILPRHSDSLTWASFILTEEDSCFMGWLSPRPPQAETVSPTAFKALKRMLIAAFSSLSISRLHLGHSWRRTESVFGTFVPQPEQFCVVL